MANNLALRVTLAAVNKITGPMKRMQKDMGKTSQEMRETRDRLKQLQGTQKDISSFRALKKQSNATAQAMRDQQARVRRLSQQMKDNQGDTAALAAERKKAILQARELSQRYDGERQKLQRLRTTLKESGVSTNDLSQDQQRLANEMRQANQSLDDQRKKLKQVAEQQRRASEARERYQRTASRGQSIAGAGSAGAVLGGAGVVAMGTQALMNQSSGARLAAQQGEGGEEAARYREVITNVYTTGRGQGLEQVTEAVGILSAQFESLGDTSNEHLQEITRQALTLSDAFGTDIAEAAQTAGIMVQNGLAKNATEAYDLMTRGMQEVSARMRDELPEILHEYGTNFRALGFDGRESLNMLVAAAEQGRYALDKTGDALKEFTIRGSDMSKASVEAYDAIGLNAQEMADAIAGGGDRAGAALTTTAQRLLDIESPAEMANTAIALFGTPIEDLSVDQIPDFLRALTQTQDRIGDVAGAAREMEETLGDNAGSAIKRVQRSLGGAFMGVLNEVDGTIIRISNSVTGWMKANPELTSTLAKAAIALSALVAVGGTALMVLGSIIGPLALIQFAAVKLVPAFMATGKALLWMGGMLKTVGALMLTNPIGLAIAGIAVAAFLIYKYWEPIKAFFVGLWQQVKAAFDEGVGGVARLLLNWSPYGLIYSAITSTVERLGISIPEGFSNFGSMIVDGIIGGITGKLGELRDSITGMASDAMGWFKDVLDINSPSRVFAEFGGNITQGLSGGIEEDADNPLKQVRGLAANLRNAAGGLMLGAGLATNASAANIDTSAIQIDARPPLQSHASAAPSAGLVIHGGINIEVHASPGMDEQALARMVNEQVQRALKDAERRAAAASRRNFYDND